MNMSHAKDCAWRVPETFIIRYVPIAAIYIKTYKCIEDLIL